jgi:hypothetical protein
VVLRLIIKTLIFALQLIKGVTGCTSQVFAVQKDKHCKYATYHFRNEVRAWFLGKLSRNPGMRRSFRGRSWHLAHRFPQIVVSEVHEVKLFLTI